MIGHQDSVSSLSLSMIPLPSSSLTSPPSSYPSPPTFPPSSVPESDLKATSTLSNHQASSYTLVSGGHDCSLRWWDVSNYSCLQEHSTHRRKFDEGIWAVKVHPLLPHVIASGGADGVCKIFLKGDARNV
jgi:hypothetical protein